MESDGVSGYILSEWPLAPYTQGLEVGPGQEEVVVCKGCVCTIEINLEVEGDVAGGIVFFLWQVACVQRQVLRAQEWTWDLSRLGKDELGRLEGDLEDTRSDSSELGTEGNRK